MAMRWSVLGAGAALLLAAPLTAQASRVCEGTETIGRCFDRLGGTLPAAETDTAQTTQARSDIREALLKKLTGLSLPASGAESAVRDFLPRFAAALLLPGLTESPGAFGGRLNLPLHDGVLFDLGMTLQPEVVFHRAEVFARALDSVPEAARAGVRERLEGGLGEFDDVSLGGALNLENRRIGRSFAPHRETVDALARSIVGARFDGRRQRLLDDFQNFVATLDASTIDPARQDARECANLTDTDALRVDCLRPASRDALERALAPAARSTADARAAAVAEMERTGFTRLADLVNNQPQFNVGVTYRSRSEVVGPSEWKAQARFELGFANMNGLRRLCRGADGPGSVTADCLARYLRHDGVRRSLNRGDRAWTAVELNHRPRYSLALADDGVALALGTATTLGVSGGYGAYFGRVEDGDGRDRLDVQARYDFTRDDALRQDRLVATAFYTLRLSDQSAALLGVTWANRPEFVGDDVTRKLRANLGVTYKLHRKEPAGADGGS